MECFTVKFIAPDRGMDFPGIRSLSARTAKGALMVMAHHEEAVMDLLPGVVLLRDDTEVVTSVIVSGAVMSVGGNVCTVVVDTLLLPGDCDLAKLADFGNEIAKFVDCGGLMGELCRADLDFINGVVKK